MHAGITPRAIPCNPADPVQQQVDGGRGARRSELGLGGLCGLERTLRDERAGRRRMLDIERAVKLEEVDRRGARDTVVLREPADLLRRDGRHHGLVGPQRGQAPCHRPSRTAARKPRSRRAFRAGAPRTRPPPRRNRPRPRTGATARGDSRRPPPRHAGSRAAPGESRDRHSESEEPRCTWGTRGRAYSTVPRMCAGPLAAACLRAMRCRTDA